VERCSKPIATFSARSAVNGEPYTIVGVAAARGLFPDEAELWTPLAVDSKEGDGW